MPQFACVPNISEGRNKSVIEDIAAAVDSTRSVKLLDITADVEMNRTVMTIIGRQSALKRAAINLIGKAIKHLDIRKHSGSHPRIGIVDVIPIVPLNDTPIEKAILLARGTAKEISEHFSLPVYLYGQAAKIAERKSLEYIREGEYEGFERKIEKPEWKPDFGPSRLHNSAGVTCVGARHPLVAINIFIDADDKNLLLSVVSNLEKRWPIGQQIRVMFAETNEKNRYKISVTILDSRSIALYEVIDVIKKELKQGNGRLHRTELVGLVTGDVLYNCLEHYLNLRDFKPAQIVDFHIFRSDH